MRKTSLAIASFCGLLGFAAQADAVLDGFSFKVISDPSVTIRYQAVVAPWNGSLLGGSGPQGASAAIWTGPVSSYTGNGAFQTISVTVPGINLTDGNWFIGLEALDGVGDTSWGMASFFSHLPNNGGGGFNFNNGPLVGTWDDFADFGDLAFTASLSTGNLDTTGAWDGSQSIAPWGVDGATAVYGQTIVVKTPDASATLSLFALGLAGLGIAGRRFRR